MANNVGEWSATAASNTSLGAVSLQENIMLVNAVNNAFRELMAQVATGISNGDFGTSVPFTAASASAAASLDFAEDTDNGTNKVTVTAPATLASDVTVTLPDATGTLALAANVLALSGGTMMGALTTNGQVAFPASQNASADANTLDDYEESDSWTPAITFATPGNLNVAYTTQTGSYTKIGRLVTVALQIVTSTFTHTTASGVLSITGLPFASKNISGTYWVGSLVWNGITKANYTDLSLTIANGVSVCNVQASGSGQTIVAITAAEMPSGGTVIFRGTLTYFTD